MKTLFKISTSLSLTLLLVMYAHAEDALKIGVVQVLKVLEQSPQYKSAGTALDKEFEPRKRKFITEQKKLKKLEEQLVRDKAIMSEAEISKMEREILNKRRELKRSQDEFREDVNFRRNEELAKIQKLVFEAVQTVSKDNGYDVVLNEGVIYASSRADITQLVIDALNK